LRRRHDELCGDGKRWSSVVLVSGFHLTPSCTVFRSSQMFLFSPYPFSRTSGQVAHAVIMYVLFTGYSPFLAKYKTALDERGDRPAANYAAATGRGGRR
jgi:hypothetical protein